MKIRFEFTLLFLLLVVTRSSGQTAEPIKVYDFEEFGCEELKIRTFNLLKEIAKYPESRGYIIGYDGKYRRFNPHSSSTFDYKYAFPRIGELKSRLGLIKKQLVWFHASPRDFVFTNGGVRQHLTIEYFVVPKGAPTPKPTPTLKNIPHVRGVAPRPALSDC